MVYKPLSLSTAVDYIKSNTSKCPHLPSDAPLLSREITDGYVNLIFVVEAQTPLRQSVLIKQALPYMRRLGPSRPLSVLRNQIEAQALLFYNEICPGLSPEVYCYDPDMHLIIMEYLKDHSMLSNHLTEHLEIPHFVDHISTFLAQTAFFSSDFCLPSEMKKKLQKSFINADMCKMMEDLVFTHPFMHHNDNKWNSLIDAEVHMVRTDRNLKLKIAELKHRFMTSTQSLIHGDLHTDSMMATFDDTRVIDPEFAFFGPTAYDVGAILTNLTLYCLSHYAYTPNQETRARYQTYLLDAIRDVWNQFAMKFTALSTANDNVDIMPRRYWKNIDGKNGQYDFVNLFLLQLLRDAAGFAACRILRQLFGMFTFHEILRITDIKARTMIEKAAIKVSVRLIHERNNIKDAEGLITIIREEAKEVVV